MKAPDNLAVDVFFTGLFAGVSTVLWIGVVALESTFSDDWPVWANLLEVVCVIGAAMTSFIAGMGLREIWNDVAHIRRTADRIEVSEP